MCPPFFTAKSQKPNLGISDPGIADAMKMTDMMTAAGPQRLIQTFMKFFRSGLSA
jgi:hypothetical protein